MCLKELRDEFLYDCECRHLAKGSLRNYRASTRFLLEFLERKQITELEDVRPRHLRDLMKEKQDAGNTPRYINDLLKVWRTWFNYLVEEGYMEERDNPAKKVKPLRQPRTIIDTFTAAEMKRMIQFYDGKDFLEVRNKTIIMLLFDTGMRCNEMILMEPEDIKTDYILVKYGKGGKERVVPKSPALSKQLIKYCALRDGYRKECPTCHRNLFLSKTGKPLTDEAVARMLKHAAEEVGVFYMKRKQKMSKNADMKGAEEDYLELEKELDKQIRQMESTHPGYDEYRYQLDEIGHDPYQLISHLTAVYEQFTRGQVKSVIKELFKQQYLLKVWETIEIRTRMETRVGIRPTIDAFENVSMETYTYEEEVEYEYKILNVLLKNKGFDTIARKNMNQKQTGRYDAYNLTYGNRPELFGAGSPTYSGGTTGSIGTGGGVGGSGGGFKYDIPSEALSDEKFARMIKEAEKYLGMPYVWGGSSPSISFDCSGFVCWVINNCGNGWSVGRTTANGLRGKCSYVSPADAQPGDLIFFEKTYNTVGASHVGIYVGNGMMIHCGDPISYTSINSTYWQSHFLGFGRIN